MSRVAEAFATAVSLRKRIEDRAVFDRAFNDLSSEERESIWSSASSTNQYEVPRKEDATCTCANIKRGRPRLYDAKARQALLEEIERDQREESHDAQNEEDSK
jgi:hypothetical protein